MYDVIIIGGSFSGIAAGLQLARARRRVLVLDAGQRRNRFAGQSHGFLGQDGQPPDAIAAKGRAELLAYPTVTWQETRVDEARAVPDGFLGRAGTGSHQAKRGPAVRLGIGAMAMLVAGLFLVAVGCETEDSQRREPAVTPINVALRGHRKNRRRAGLRPLRSRSQYHGPPERKGRTNPKTERDQ